MRLANAVAGHSMMGLCEAPALPVVASVVASFTVARCALSLASCGRETIENLGDWHTMTALPSMSSVPTVGTQFLPPIGLSEFRLAGSLKMELALTGGTAGRRNGIAVVGLLGETTDNDDDKGGDLGAEKGAKMVGALITVAAVVVRATEAVMGDVGGGWWVRVDGALEMCLMGLVVVIGANGWCAWKSLLSGSWLDTLELVRHRFWVSQGSGVMEGNLHTKRMETF